MSGEPNTYSQTCSMKLGEVAHVCEMIASHDEFSGIGVTIYLDRRTYDPSPAGQTSGEKALVTFRIPLEGITMPDFFREFSNTLNQESTVMAQKERVW